MSRNIVTNSFYKRNKNLTDIVSITSKLKALLEIGMSGNLNNCTSESLYNYLWVLNDLALQLEEVIQ